MVNRATQSPEYWSAFKFTASDADFISNHLLETGAPKPCGVLALELVRHRVDRENSELRRQMERASIYQPKLVYSVGDNVMFPALAFATGTVVEKRIGRNPEAGAFDVVKLAMSDGAQREFVCNYAAAHALNDEANITAMLNQVGEVRTPEQLFEAHAEALTRIVDAALEAREAFIRISGEWFLRELMADVNVGHLNLAEAVLEMANGGPLPTPVILRDLGLPEEVARSLQEVSLNTALAVDARFDEVSLTDAPAWFLRRLEPAEVRELPLALRNPSRVQGEPQAALDQLARDIDDELDYAEVGNPSGEMLQSANVVLTFPHRRAGTLGWGRKLAGLLPDVSKSRLPIFFKDKGSGKQYTVWLVRDGRYIFGLAEWYKANEIPAGAEIEVARTSAPNIYTIDAHRHKPRREWVRFASVRDGRIRLETAQKAITCQVDDLMAVFVDDPAVFDPLRAMGRDVGQVVRDVFPEIAKLSPQGNVHAATLYATVNVITRAAPRDVFVALSNSDGLFTPVGDYYWHLSDRG